MIESERETAEIAAVTETTRSERGEGAAPGSAGGDPEAVKRTIESVAEKKVEIKRRIRTKTETGSAGVAVETANVTKSVTGKRRKREQKERL